MIRDYLIARRYLAPSVDAFWRWSDEGGVLTWSHGSTLAFREELVTVLRRLESTGLPGFTEIALVLAACRDNWPETSRSVLEAHPLFRWQRLMQPALMRDTLAGLDRVRGLPGRLRGDPHVRAELMAMIFEGQPHLASASDTAAVLRSLEGEMPAELLLPQRMRRFRHDLAVSLHGLRRGLARVDAEALALRCRTGLEAPVKPAELDLEPDEGVRALLSRLESDEELGGLARLALNLMAAIHLPRSLSDQDDLPVGGLSDLTNRGPLDRLLLSELAHDDLTLVTRIALNEALYLRREAPPRTPPRQRAILIDCGVRTWGVPRVFATAVALALAAATDEHTMFRAWRAAADQVAPVDLSRRAGLISHLEVLEPEAHPGAAVPAFLAVTAGEASDLLLITTPESFDDADFRHALAAAESPSMYVATVSRRGEFRLLARGPRGSKLLREARLDLDSLLAPRPAALPLIDSRRDPSLPAILFVKPFPLRLPHAVDAAAAWPVRSRGESGGPAAGVRGLARTRDRRLMFWDQPGRGARQLDDRAPRGQLLWCDPAPLDHQAQAVVGLLQQRELSLATIDLTSGVCRWDSIALGVAEHDRGTPLGVCAHGGMLFVVFRSHLAIIDRADGRLVRMQGTPDQLKWEGGRFFRSRAGWLALSFDGTAAHLEPVANEPSAPALIGLFERPGTEGPIGITADGNLYFTASQSLQITAAAQSPEPLSRYYLLAVGHDGQHVVLGSRPHAMPPRHEQQMCVIYVPNSQSWPASGNPQFHANPSPWWGAVSSRNLRHRFSSIGISRENVLTLVSARGNRWNVLCDGKPHEMLFKMGAFANEPIRLRVNFQEIKSPPGTGYRLRAAVWSDGSRAIVDSRGLLHLKSSDASLPELTLVLTGGQIAGWCSDGRIWGPDYYTGDAANAAPADVYRDVIQRFVRILR